MTKVIDSVKNTYNRLTFNPMLVELLNASEKEFISVI